MTHVDEYVVDGTRWLTAETLRFPTWDTITRGLRESDFELVEAWGDWDGTPVTDQSPEWIILAATAEIGDG